MQRAIRWTTFAVAVLLVVGTVNLVTKKHVTLVVDGRTQAIATTSSDVSQLLVGEGIELTSNIQVVPPPTTRLADGMTVVVSPAADTPGAIPGEATDQGSAGVGVWVVDRATVGSAFASQLAETSVSAARVGKTSAVSVRVVVCGKVHDVLTNAGTAGELLSAMGVQPDANDHVYPSPQTPLHDRMWVRYDRVHVGRVQRLRHVPFEIYTTYTDRLAPGVVQVLRHGKPGLALQSYRVVRIDGKVLRRRMMESFLRRSPVAETRISGPAPSWAGTLGDGAHTETGLASWYDPPWSGLTAAHPWLPFGTHVRVTDLATGRSVVVIINDRGPFAPGKIIDLSPEAFQILSPLGRGVLNIRLSW